MGHRFSKTAANNIAATTAKTTTTHHLLGSAQQEQEQDFQKTTNRISIPSGHQNHHFVGPTINLQIQESPNNATTTQQTTCNNNNLTTTAGIQHHQQQSSTTTTSTSISSSLTSVNNLSCGGRQIIIKIQLAKMENGNEMPSQQHQDTSLEQLTADCNLNSTELSATTTAVAAGAQILNLTLNSNSMPNATTSTTTTSASLSRTAGSSLTKNNNYLNSKSGGNNTCSSSSSSASSTTSTIVNNHHLILSNSSNERLGRLNTLQFNDEIVEQNIGEIVEYCEVLEDQQHQPLNSNNMQQTLLINEEPDNETNVCCRRKSKSLAAKAEGSMSATNATGAKTKSSRCRKCSCRDAFRRILDPSLSRSSNKANKQQQQKEQKRPKSQDRHSIINNPLKNTKTNQQQRHTMHSTTAATLVSPTASTSAHHRVSLWTPTTATTTNVSDVVIPLTTTPSQFVVVQCAIVNANNAPAAVSNTNTTTTTSSSNTSTFNLPNSLLTTSNDLSLSSNPNDLTVQVPSSSRTVAVGAATGPVVHSQVDFVHYLVPDLERITNSSFYWGKMDRYEAERLLEGKAEGTFLLRDSAQEEFLFSVTFRKYGRSLHARIEQSGHRFSFDCHDPCVFTAPTVTGLLEHYKDPACVMFFEPMLTIPLHRKNCFSLQKLCRATIVSNTTYDGINDLELPARLKSYLKEYHYKQKLRVKSNEPTYTIHCK